MAVPRAELSAALAAREALFLAAPGPVMMYAPGGHLIRANLLARDQPQLVAEPPVAALAAAIERIGAGETVEAVELTVYSPERRRYEAQLRPFTTEDGPGCIAMLKDVSSAVDFREARRLFSAGVSHELRTPLARILGLTDTVALPLEESERQSTIEQIRAEIDAMRRLIEEMVLLVQLESHELTGIGERADVDDAVRDCVDRHAHSATANGMTLELNTTRGLVAAVLPRLLDVVLDNLVTNAITHAGSGATIRVSARGLAGAVELSVSDTGTGIPDEHVARVFERFYRVEDARSTPGTGLGLAIVKHIAEEYGGRASIESVPGEGTTITVVLPAPAAVRP
jgi:signal transduction histidine kinase